MKYLSPRIWLIPFAIGSGLLFGCAPFLATSASSTATPAIAPPTLTQAATSPTRIKISPIATINASATIQPAETQTPFPSPAATEPLIFPSSFLPTALKYQLIDQFGEIFFCDPDLYPVAHEVSDQEIAQRVAEIQKNAEEYQAILQRLGLQNVTNLSPEQKRQIDAEHKRLNAIQLAPKEQAYHFTLRIAESAERGFFIEGVIAPGAAITVTKKELTILQCPICLAASTLIDTPAGAIPVQDLRKGMSIWTVDRSGMRRVGVILETASRPMPANVSLVHLVLDDGRDLLVSAGHPTFRGQPIGVLAVGKLLDGAHIVRADPMPYTAGVTFDLLSSGERGAYWANGVLLGSTLLPAPTREQ